MTQVLEGTYFSYLFTFYSHSCIRKRLLRDIFIWSRNFQHWKWRIVSTWVEYIAVFIRWKGRIRKYSANPYYSKILKFFRAHHCWNAWNCFTLFFNFSWEMKKFWSLQIVNIIQFSVDIFDNNENFSFICVKSAQIILIFLY